MEINADAVADRRDLGPRPVRKAMTVAGEPIIHELRGLDCLSLKLMRPGARAARWPARSTDAYGTRDAGAGGRRPCDAFGREAAAARLRAQRAADRRHGRLRRALRPGCSGPVRTGLTEKVRSPRNSRCGSRATRCRRLSCRRRTPDRDDADRCSAVSANLSASYRPQEYTGTLCVRSMTPTSVAPLRWVNDSTPRPALYRGAKIVILLLSW